ncbi:MAG: zinc ABC transporter substrate-binding protein [Bacteroidetes bacterium]|nr:zinc ABC transporter substrate-binding protein [Bacteroidota bacterium]
MKNLRNSILLGVLAFLVSCGGNSKQHSSKVYIVTTTGMIADAVKNIADTLFEVEALMGPGVDPHLYKAKQSDTKKLLEADVVFYNGVHLEGKMAESLESLAQSKSVFAVADGIPENMLISTSQFSGTHDPHIWFDVKLWVYVVKHISAKLQEKYPEYKEHFQKNTEKYLKHLEEFNGWVTEEIKKIPDSTRILVTAHDAFSYFGRAYGMKVEGLQGISTVSEPSIKGVTDLVNHISQSKVRSIFMESSVSARFINAVVDGCKEKGHDLKLGGTLYSDAMGAAGTDEGTYIGMIRHNVNTIVGGLK